MYQLGHVVKPTIHLAFLEDLHMYYIYIYMLGCVYICIYIYIYIHTSSYQPFLVSPKGV